MPRIYLLTAATSIAIAVNYIFGSIGGAWFSPFMETLGFRDAAFGVILYAIVISVLSIGASIYWLTQVSDQATTANALIIALAYSVMAGLPLVSNLTLVTKVPGKPPIELVNLLYVAVQLLFSAMFSLGFLKAFSRTKLA